MFEQALALLEHLAETGPVVLVIEDAQWSDRSTRDLLIFLVGNQQVLGGTAVKVIDEQGLYLLGHGGAGSLPRALGRGRPLQEARTAAKNELLPYRAWAVPPSGGGGSCSHGAMAETGRLVAVPGRAYR